MSENDTSESQDKAEELLSQSKSQSRLSSEASDQSATEQDESEELSLADAVANAYEDLDQGELHQNLTVRDEDLAALVTGLEKTGQLNNVAQRAYNRLDLEDEPSSRADFIKAALRLALSEIGEEEVEAAKEGKRKHLTQQADTF